MGAGLETPCSPLRPNNARINNGLKNQYINEFVHFVG